MPLIEIKNLEKTFFEEDSSPTYVLRGINLTIDKGEFVAIVGPSGSGKSTLLQILGLLDRPTSGTYTFQGKSVDSYSDDEQAELRNRALGFIFQSFNLLPRVSVLENVKLPLAYSSISPKLWDAQAKKQITAVDLDHRMEHEPAQLSRGERQRVAIARALINDPDLILADEPTGSLDSANAAHVLDLLDCLRREKELTIIMVTHSQRDAAFSRRVVHLFDGQIINENLNKLD